MNLKQLATRLAEIEAADGWGSWKESLEIREEIRIRFGLKVLQRTLEIVQNLRSKK